MDDCALATGAWLLNAAYEEPKIKEGDVGENRTIIKYVRPQRMRATRIYQDAEHFNGSWTKATLDREL